MILNCTTRTWEGSSKLTSLFYQCAFTPVLHLFIHLLNNPFLHLSIHLLNTAVKYGFIYFFYFWHNSLQWARASSFTRFLDHTQWPTTAGRTPLDEWSAHRRDLYLTTHNTHNRQIYAPHGIWTHNLSRWAATDLCLRLHGHWDWRTKD